MVYCQAKPGTIYRIEAELGRPFTQVVSGLAAQKYSQRMAAEELGLNENTFRQLMRHFPEITWPTRNGGIRRQAAYQSVADKMRAHGIANAHGCEAAIKVDYKGELLLLSEVSVLTGVKYQTLLQRYKNGKRGRALFKQAHQTKGKAKRNYRLGITAGEADLIITYANEHGIRAAHCKFGIPFGAVRALRDGEWHRID
jgi:hypothetical protein